MGPDIGGDESDDNPAIRRQMHTCVQIRKRHEHIPARMHACMHVHVYVAPVWADMGGVGRGGADLGGVFGACWNESPLENDLPPTCKRACVRACICVGVHDCSASN